MGPRFFILILGLLTGFGSRAETLDRIAVTVGKHVISEHDALQDVRISAYLDGKAPDLSGEQKRKAADRLIDQYLLVEDAAFGRAAAPGAVDPAAMLAPLKGRYHSDEEYRDSLVQAQITEDELSQHLLAGLRMMRYTDLRFRPEVQISEESLRAYYAKLAPAQTFEASRTQIEKLLTDQQTMQALERWLSMARTQIPIIYREDVFK